MNCPFTNSLQLPNIDIVETDYVIVQSFSYFTDITEELYIDGQGLCHRITISSDV